MSEGQNEAEYRRSDRWKTRPAGPRDLREATLSTRSFDRVQDHFLHVHEGRAFQF